MHRFPAHGRFNKWQCICTSYGRKALLLWPLWFECFISAQCLLSPLQRWPLRWGSEHAARWKCQLLDESESRIFIQCVAFQSVVTCPQWGPILLQLKETQTFTVHISLIWTKTNTITKQTGSIGNITVSSLYRLWCVVWSERTKSHFYCLAWDLLFPVEQNEKHKGPLHYVVWCKVFWYLLAS